MEKWDAIRKKPAKLFSMFTGYHTTPATIQVAFVSAGIDDEKLSNLWTLNQDDSKKLVGSLVSKFLQLRFPILLALNKADLPEAQRNIEKFQEKFKDMSMIPVSAKAECLLQQGNKAGTVKYQSGACFFEVLSSLHSKESEDPSIKHNGIEIGISDLNRLEETVFKTYGDTGVLKALSCAVRLRPPVYAFPVQCLDTCQAISVHQTEKPQVLRDCLVLKPGTTVGKLFNVMTYQPVSLLAGDYVRAECIDENRRKKVLHKDEVINESNQILRIMSTKRAMATNKSRS